MNCQHASEHDSQNHLENTDPQPMETMDYLRLASFIQYLRNGTAEPHNPENSGVVEA